MPQRALATRREHRNPLSHWPLASELEWHCTLLRSSCRRGVHAGTEQGLVYVAGEAEVLAGLEARKRSSKEKRLAKGTPSEGSLCTALNILGGKRELRDGRAETALETAVRELDEETAYPRPPSCMRAALCFACSRQAPCAVGLKG